MSQMAATWTSFMAAHSPTWARPRPFTPQTAIRRTSLGPARRGFARRGIGTEAAAAAIIDPCRNSRRLSLLMNPPLDVFRNHKGLAVLAAEKLVGLVVAHERFVLAVDRQRPADAQRDLREIDVVVLQVRDHPVERVVAGVAALEGSVAGHHLRLAESVGDAREVAEHGREMALEHFGVELIAAPRLEGVREIA